MKIALVAPLEEPVPPRTYGGTELVVYNLAEELVAMGHEVVLFASGESKTSARLEPVFESNLRCDPDARNTVVREAMKVVGIGRILERLNAEEFDIIHNHYGWRLLPFAGLLRAPVVTTLHGPLTVPYYRKMFGLLPPHPFVSISDSQRRPMPDLNFVGTVYNGIDCDRFDFNPAPGDYVVFLGRFSPEKGPVQAIRCAREAGVPLVMAGKIDAVDREYWEREVEPLIDGDQVRFIGEVNHEQKNALLRDARAILVPIAWEEPFGLVMVEAMATGTPVIANRRGSVPELVAPGTGFIVDTPEEMTAAIGRLTEIDRQACRDHVCRRFSRRTMAEGYVAAYERVIESAAQLLGPQAETATLL